jgi:hypothetical protein
VRHQRRVVDLLQQLKRTLAKLRGRCRPGLRDGSALPRRRWADTARSPRRRSPWREIARVSGTPCARFKARCGTRSRVNPSCDRLWTRRTPYRQRRHERLARLFPEIGCILINALCWWTLDRLGLREKRSGSLRGRLCAWGRRCLRSTRGRDAACACRALDPTRHRPWHVDRCDQWRDVCCEPDCRGRPAPRPAVERIKPRGGGDRGTPAPSHHARSDPYPSAVARGGPAGLWCSSSRMPVQGTRSF